MPNASSSAQASKVPAYRKRGVGNRVLRIGKQLVARYVIYSLLCMQCCHTHNSIAHRNICARQWKEQFLKGTTNEFNAYWSELSSDKLAVCSH